MDGAIADLDRPLAVEPGEAVLYPVPVIAFGVVLACMGAAALCPVLGRVQGYNRLLQQVLEFERFDEVGVPDHRAIGDAEIGETAGDHIDPADPFPQHLRSAEYGAIALHNALHVEPDLAGLARAARMPDRIQPGDGLLADTVRQWLVWGAGPLSNG